LHHRHSTRSTHVIVTAIHPVSHHEPEQLQEGWQWCQKPLLLEEQQQHQKLLLLEERQQRQKLLLLEGQQRRQKLLLLLLEGQQQDHPSLCTKS
jgi:hypothetical protein